MSRILKGDEFTELQQRAEEKIAGLRRELAENGGRIEQANAILYLVGAPAEGLPHEQKEGDPLRPGQARPCSCRSVNCPAYYVGLPARIEFSRQNSEGLVRERGQIVIDGKLIKDDGLFAVERTAAVSGLNETGVLRDQGGGIPSGWISTADGKIARA